MSEYGGGAMEFSVENVNGYLGKMISSSQRAEVTLNKAEIFVLSSEPNHTNIECLDGILWITQNNDVKDYFIKEGQTFSATNRGRVLIQGFPFGRASITVRNNNDA